MQAYKNTIVENGETPPSLPSLTSYTDETVVLYCILTGIEEISALVIMNVHQVYGEL